MRSKFSWPPDACSSSSFSADAGNSAVKCYEETQPLQSQNDERSSHRSVVLSTAADGSHDCQIKTKWKYDGVRWLATLEDSVNTAFEPVVTDSRTTYENKVIALIKTWKACKILCDHFNGTHVFVHFAASDSTILILDPRWTSISKTILSDFILVLHSISKELQDINYECCKETLKRLNFLISIIEDPCGNSDLSHLITGETSKDKVFDFFKMSEQPHVFASRLKLLSDENSETEALKLSTTAGNFLYDNELLYSYHKIQDFEFIKDVYHGCLIQSFEMDKFSNHLKEFISRNDSKNLMKVYASKIYILSNLPKEDRPRICDDVVVAGKMIADILVAESLRNADLYDDFSDLIAIWIAIMSKLIESNFKQNMDISCLKDTVSRFIECAESSCNLYLFYEILDKNFGSKLPLKLYLEMYMKALCNNLNEIEFYKYLEDVELSANSVTELIQGYLKLADILENVVSVSRECVLTAFSLRPSEDLMHRIQNLAIKSGKLRPEHLIDVNANSCDNSDNKSFMDNNYNYAYDDSNNKIRSDLNNLSDPLTPTMQNNLIMVVQNPRYGSLNWDLKWPEMKLLCQEFLDCSDTMNRRHTLRREDLIYVDMDIEKYNMDLENLLKESGLNDLNDSIPGTENESVKESLQQQRSRQRPSKAISSKKILKRGFKSSSRNILSKQHTIASQKNIEGTSNTSTVSNPKKKFKFEEKGFTESDNREVVLSSESLRKQKGRGIGSQENVEVTSDLSDSNGKKKFNVEEKVTKVLTCKGNVNLTDSVQKKRGRGRSPKAISSKKKSKAALQNTPKIILSKEQIIGSQENVEVTSDFSDSNEKKKFNVEEKVTKVLPCKGNVNLTDSVQKKRGRGRPPKVISKI